ncbi:hypothetical protein M747DRAFT_319053 [Aspergillus niger ATCC 13496]|uniref:Uncharacterized protein n=1 Tax=Aspergillus niger ATCC 13496 TaxID=1353008 RepID=A0A370BLA4_ASPNG|nr:hypothetical protein M747DRAFT_319053 [Aspergillus niger ATCC 13496]
MSVVPIETNEVSDFCTRSYFLECDSIFLWDVLLIIKSTMINWDYFLDISIWWNPACLYHWCKSRRSTAASIRLGFFILIKIGRKEPVNEVFVAFATARPEKFKIYRFLLLDSISFIIVFDASLDYDSLNH